MIQKTTDYSIFKRMKGNREILPQQLEQVKPYLEEGVWKDRDFIIALYQTYQTVSHLELMEKLKGYPNKVQRRLKTKDYLRQMEEIIGYSSRRTVRLF